MTQYQFGPQCWDLVDSPEYPPPQIPDGQSLSPSYPAPPGSPARSGGTQLRSRQQSPSGDEKGPRQETTAPHKSFACPFTKRDPESHQHCFGMKLSRITDVRLHLGRYHRNQAPIRCPRCGLVFHGPRKDPEWRQHTASKRCNKRELVPSSITDKQWELMKPRGKPTDHFDGTVYEWRWYQIYGVLFPGVEFPETPYPRPVFEQDSCRAVQSFIDQGHLDTLVNRYPAHQRGELRMFGGRLLGAYRDHAGGQETAETTMDPPPPRMTRVTHAPSPGLEYVTAADHEEVTQPDSLSRQQSMGTWHEAEQTDGYPVDGYGFGLYAHSGCYAHSWNG